MKFIMQKIASVILLLGLQIGIACGMPQLRTYQVPKKDTLTCLAMSIGQHWYNGDQGVPFNMNLIVNRHWGGSLSFKKYYFRSLERPEDYNPVSFFLWFWGGEIIEPQDELKTASMMFGYYQYSRNNLWMIGAECGPSLVHLDRAKYKKNSNGSYAITYKPYDAIGAEFRLKLGAPLLRYVGVEAVGYANLNGLKSTYGLELNLCLGLLRGRYQPGVKSNLNIGQSN